MKVVWAQGFTETPLTFSKLGVGETFKIDSHLSQGAVYRKVKVDEQSVTANRYFMEELATGHLFKPTNSFVKRVDASLTIDAKKPNLAGY